MSSEIESFGSTNNLPNQPAFVDENRFVRAKFMTTHAINAFRIIIHQLAVFFADRAHRTTVPAYIAVSATAVVYGRMCPDIRAYHLDKKIGNHLQLGIGRKKKFGWPAIDNSFTHNGDIAHIRTADTRLPGDI